MPGHKDLIDAATAQTGLDDFGADSFLEGLEILVRSLRHAARLSAVGEAFVYPRIVGHLAQRLQVEDWYRRHPEIGDVPIVAPPPSTVEGPDPRIPQAGGKKEI